jgi:uncharacterized membrane protein YgdD (TMEM256/DUF423 family)
MIRPHEDELAGGCPGFSAVALGAFGAHGLKPTLIAHDALGLWETAALYHLAHAVAALWATGRNRLALVLWTTGIAFFSGSLYLMALTQLRWLGSITPIGGVLLLAGWLAAARTRCG